VVGAIQTFGGRVLEQSGNSRVREASAFPCSIAGFVQHPRHAFHALLCGEHLIHEFAHGCLGRIHDEFFVFPHVAKRSSTAQTLAQFGSHFDRSFNAVCDFLAFPLGKRSNHGVEEAAGRRGGVDFLLKRNHVGVVLAKEIREIQELLGVAGKAGEL